MEDCRQRCLDNPDCGRYSWKEAKKRNSKNHDEVFKTTVHMFTMFRQMLMDVVGIDLRRASACFSAEMMITSQFRGENLSQETSWVLARQVLTLVDIYYLAILEGLFSRPFKVF